MRLPRILIATVLIVLFGAQQALCACAPASAAVPAPTAKDMPHGTHHCDEDKQAPDHADCAHCNGASYTILQAAPHVSATALADAGPPLFPLPAIAAVRSAEFAIPRAPPRLLPEGSPPRTLVQLKIRLLN